MVYLKKYFIFIFIFSLAMFFGSCQDKTFTGTVNCNECYSPKPDSAQLILHITLNNQFSSIPVVIYKGNIDTGLLIDTFDCYTDPVNDIWVEADNKYSAKAIYGTAKDTIMVVDGTEMKFQKVTGQCNSDCWVINGNELNLKLAF
jgi:hypothetical protein